MNEETFGVGGIRHNNYRGRGGYGNRGGRGGYGQPRTGGYGGQQVFARRGRSNDDGQQRRYNNTGYGEGRQHTQQAQPAWS